MIQIGNATLYLGDCAEILPTLGKFNAVITDPPYGLGKKMLGTRFASNGNKEVLKWDLDINQNVVNLILNLSIPTIIWGGNYYDLPPNRGFLIWDKNNPMPTYADCEMAWTNQDKNARIFVMRPMNMDGGKEHPTQKPIKLMEWCINYLDNPNLIIDPFMGSGSTGVACMNMGKTFIGIEKEKKYFDIACQRIEYAQKQEKLFA